jgi:non-heme chloroperoxidase
VRIFRALPVLPLLLAAACAAATQPARTAPDLSTCESPTLLPAYAHNDYANSRPLFDALALGFRGVEVDLFLVGGSLVAGHERASATAGRTLETLYLDPLRRRKQHCGRIIAGSAPFLLAIELKERDRAAFDSLVAVLGRYAELFEPAAATPAEVVLVGWHPPVAEMHPDGRVPLRLQARVGGRAEQLEVDTSSVVRLVSLDYGKTVRWSGQGPVPPGATRWLAALGREKGAGAGRMARVHNVPTNASVYRLLLGAGVDLLGTKEPEQSREVLLGLHGDVWPDPSPHHTRFVTVRDGVRLEVLDWGGTGPPLLFLAGLGDNAHEFDDFAPRFTDRAHVLALTRRGYGQSSRPDSGYDVATLAEDIGLVLDQLGLRQVDLVGHSFGGDEISRFAAAHPERVRRIVYLDAAHDRTELPALLRDWPPPPAMTRADSASPAAVRAWVARTGVVLPEGEIRNMFVFGADGRLLRESTPDSMYAVVLGQLQHPAYARISAPALAVYAVADSAMTYFKGYAPMDSAGAARARGLGERLDAWAAAERKRFRREMPHGRTLELRGAHHYVFISNAAEVEAAMRAFLAER